MPKHIPFFPQVIDAFHYVIEEEATVGSYKYLLKTDSDSIVCISRMIRWLRQDHLPATGVYAGELQMYYGRLDSGLNHKFDDHNYVTIFKRDTYAPYNLGGGRSTAESRSTVESRRAAAE